MKSLISSWHRNFCVRCVICTCIFYFSSFNTIIVWLVRSNGGRTIYVKPTKCLASKQITKIDRNFLKPIINRALKSFYAPLLQCHNVYTHRRGFHRLFGFDTTIIVIILFFFNSISYMITWWAILLKQCLSKRKRFERSCKNLHSLWRMAKR